MNALVYSTEQSIIPVSWESQALRTGFILNNGVLATGHSPFSIGYEQGMIEAFQTLEAKLRYLEEFEEFKQFGQTAEEMIKFLKSVKKDRQGGKKALVFYKQTESVINKIFSEQISSEVTAMESHGLVQLSNLTDNEGFYVCALQEKDGESYGGYANLSFILGMQNVNEHFLEEDRIYGLFAFMLYAQLAETVVSDKVELTPLVTLPNLISLNTTQLRNVKQALKPIADRLDKLLLPCPPHADGTHYVSGIWDMASIPQLAQELQAAIDANTDIQWAKKMSMDWSSQLAVGMIETPALWQLLRDHSLVPDDTWQVLQQWVKEKHYSPKMAIFDLRMTPGLVSLDSTMAITDIEQYTRKTLDID